MAKLNVNGGAKGELVELTEAQKILLAPEVDASSHGTQNPDILFWKPEIEISVGEMKRNPIRGFLLSVFDRPKGMGSANDDGEERRSLASWVLLTRPTHVSDRNGDVIEAKVGSVVWMDLNQSILSLVNCALPKLDADGKPVELVEFAVHPIGKVSFKKAGQTYQAWRMRLTGGRTAARSEGYRIFDAKQIGVLGSSVTIPEVLISVDHAAHLAGLGSGQESELLLPQSVEN